LGLATTLAGSALAAQGQAQQGAELMQRGMRAWRGIGAQQSVTYQLGLLAPVYAWFSEGFDTADLIEARDLLKALEEG